MTRAKGTVALVVALLLAGLLVGLLGFSATLNPIDVLLGRGAIVSVPDLSGRPRPGAEADLRAAGLVPEVRSGYSLTGKRGTVVGQTPSAGARVRAGTKVAVVVSRGINRVAMPDAVGKPFDAVRKQLDDAGVKIKVERRASEDAARGVVISQDPGPGVLVTGEDSVDFVVSDGPATRPVPNVTGLDLAGAAFLLGKSGFAIGTVTPVDDANAVAGSVLRTEPASGTVAARDTTVNISQAAGPPAVPMPQLVGQSGDAAASAATALGLVPNVIRQGSGGVVSQDPAPAAMVRPGDVVTVTVGSSGG